MAAEVTAAGVAEGMGVAAAPAAAVAISQGAVMQDMPDAVGTAVAEGTVVIGVAMEGEEATDMAAVMAVGDGAALAWGSDSISRRSLIIMRRFGAPTACLITMPTTTTISGKAAPISMKP